ncbi:DoxX family protein [Wohlfahrtiimonas larvae]|uniref:DoxX family protein n=1 Tax=Wohlfahrtiimonas larvae TaxID=1157986 RepID=A0ABP9MH54_9GAMM|nr:DoxX family protein [Wohlfahrtiimonas larvae]
MLTFDKHIETLINRPSINNSLMLAGRALMAYLFIIAGWNKIVGYSGTVAYMESQGIPGSLAILVILLELGGGLAILIGYQTRIIAVFLALFCIMTGIIFHGAPEDATSLMKNLAMAGGFIYILVQGSGKFSIDHLLTHK